MSDKDPSALDYRIFHDDFPLHSHSCILNTGSCGAGKSFFCYKVLLPIYIKYLGIKALLICSRTGTFDNTTRTELKNPIYKDVAVEFIKLEDSFKRCQEIRGQAIINEYLQKCMIVKDEKHLVELRKDFLKLINSDSKVPQLVDELRRFDRDVLSKFMLMDIDMIHDWAELMFTSGERYVKDVDIPQLIVMDDYAGDSAFLKPSSEVHKLLYVRRHLRLSMILNTQSLTAVSANIRRNCTVFVNFSTLSEKDIELLADRVPYSTHFNKKALKEAFIQIAQAEKRNDQIITLFTVLPHQKVVMGSPKCLDEFYT